MNRIIDRAGTHRFAARRWPESVVSVCASDRAAEAGEIKINAFGQGTGDRKFQWEKSCCGQINPRASPSL